MFHQWPLIPHPRKGTFAASMVLVLGVLGTAVYSSAVSDSYPPEDWLFWQIGSLWLWASVFSIASVCFGQWLLEWVLKVTGLNALESAVLATSIGTVAFTIGMYGCGACGQFNSRSAVLLPLAMVAVGGHSGIRLFRQLASEAREARTSAWTWAAAGLGLLLVSLIYLGAMTPEAISTDASMVHMRIAEDYARSGRLMRFVASYPACVPQLASIIYTWAFLVPGLCAAQKWMLCLHLEFCLLLWTLVGISALVKRQLRDFRIPAGWVSLFLFPGIYCSDSNLGGAADHVVAFFSVSIVLAALGYCKGFKASNAALLGIACAGAILTKYQAIYLIFGAGVVVGVSWVRELHRCFTERKVSARWRYVLPSPLVLLVTLAVCASPHFIKNIVYYHNPVFPFMQETFKSTPSFPGIVDLVAHLYEDKTWVPAGTLSDKAWHSVGLFFTFSFKPHYFTRQTPYFGSLFTLLLPSLLFIRRSTDLRRVAAIGSLCLLLWGMTFNVDRNLQTFMPVLAATTGALIVKLWGLGWVARLGLVPLVAFQVIWGSDLPVFDANGSRIKGAMDLIATGHSGEAKHRFDRYRRDYIALGEATPKGAKLLMHLGYDALGIGREVLLDRPSFQGQFYYKIRHSSSELFEYYRSLGITHLIMDAREDHAAVIQDEVLIRVLLHRSARHLGTFGAYKLWELKREAPSAEKPYKVLALGVTAYTPGLYPIDDMDTVEYLRSEWKHYHEPEARATSDNLVELLQTANAVVIRKGYVTSDQFEAALNKKFEFIDKWSEDSSLFLRR